MRRRLAALACSLVPATAAADDAGGPASVIGGSDARPGKWPDVAAVLFPDASGDDALCTGTLIAPNLVITAGHCYDPLDPPLPDNVLIGASSLAHPGDGETIAIQRAFVYPDPDATEDLALLVLAHASSRKPRQVIDGWARTDVVDGAAVALVGFGAINAAGDHFVDQLQEATTKITDAGCTTSPGCNPGAQPDGELGAGGMGIDTCPGDSGGPLYLITGYGAVLAGVTSRSYDDAPLPCSGGGIYVRPDKVLDWIEQTAGVRLSRVGAPSADPLIAVHGAGDDVRIHVNDPASDDHGFEITAPPAHATARVRGDGAIRVCVDPAAPPGDDQVTVKITDSRHAGRALSLTIPIHVEDGAAPATCDLAAFSEGGGCCDAGGSAGAAFPLALGVLGLARRRRPRAPRER